MTQDTLLNVNGLSRSFNATVAIQNLSFEIQRGEVVALLGTNGAGKSTTLNIITGNLKPDMGEVLICGENLLVNPKLAKQNIGYLPDTPPLYRELNVIEYLRFAAEIHGIEKRKLKKQVEKVIQECGLETVRRKLIAKLSKGFQQRVGIAQSLVHEPALVILDEPTIGLDPLQIQEIRTLLSELSQHHSVLLSTHLLSEVESSCDRVLIIDQGCIVLDQSLKELNKSSAKRVKLRFQGSPNVEQLKAIRGCESVSCSQFGNYVCRYSDMGFLQQIQILSIENDWQLYEISPLADNLERVFLDFVVRDNTSTNHDLGNY